MNGNIAFVSKNHYICRVLEVKRHYGFSDIPGTLVPDGVLQHPSGVVMGEGFRP